MYKPVVPEWIGEILYLDKKRQQNQYSGSIATGKEKKDFDAWKRKYSRKYKYAMLNGWETE